MKHKTKSQHKSDTPKPIGKYKPSTKNMSEVKQTKVQGKAERAKAKTGKS